MTLTEQEQQLAADAIHAYSLALIAGGFLDCAIAASTAQAMLAANNIADPMFPPTLAGVERIGKWCAFDFEEARRLAAMAINAEAENTPEWERVSHRVDDMIGAVRRG